MKKIYLLLVEIIFLMSISIQVVYAEIKINPDNKGDNLRASSR